MSIWRQLRAILALPFAVTVGVPGVMLYPWRHIRWGWNGGPAALVAAMLLAAAGLILVAATVRLFAGVGDGTLAPWDAPRHLVVRGPYRYVRNPMISGVIAILSGEALAFGKLEVLSWWLFFVALNATYIPILEEPGLLKRFGAEYRDYKAHVPRWIPRLTPWEPGQ